MSRSWWQKLFPSARPSRRQQRPPAKPQLLPLEDRTTPATINLVGSDLQITYDMTGAPTEEVTVDNDGTNLIFTGDVTQLPIQTNLVKSITAINMGGGDVRSLTLQGMTFVLENGLSAPTTAVNGVTFNNTDVDASSGAGGIIVEADTITFSDGTVDLTTNAGEIALTANGAGGLQVGNLTTTTGTVTLSAPNGDIGQVAGTKIIAPTLGVTNGQDVTLTSVNNQITNVSVATSKSFALTSKAALNVATPGITTTAGGAALTVTDNNSLTINAPVSVTGGDGQMSAETVTIDADVTVTTVSGVGGQLTITNTGTLSIGAVTITADSSFAQNGAGAVVLTGDATVTSLGTPGTVTFQSSINGTGDGTESLTVNAATTASFGRATAAPGIGSGTNTQLEFLSVSAPSGITILGNANGTVRTKGSQTYTGPVTLDVTGVVTFDSTANGDVSFSSTIDGVSNGVSGVTVSTGGTAKFLGSVGGTKSLSALSATAASIVLSGAQVNTTGGQTYTGPVILDRNGVVALQSTAAGDITFSSTVDASAANTDKAGLSVNTASPGKVSFGGSIGASNRLSTLTVAGTPAATTIKGSVVNTASDQTFAKQVTIDGSVSTITFNLGSGTATFNGGLLANQGAGANVVVIADDVIFENGGANSVVGLGTKSLTITPAQASSNIVLGAAHPVAGALVQSNGDLTAVTGFGFRVIGRIDGTGTITVNPGTTYGTVPTIVVTATNTIVEGNAQDNLLRVFSKNDSKTYIQLDAIPEMQIAGPNLTYNGRAGKDALFVDYSGGQVVTTTVAFDGTDAAGDLLRVSGGGISGMPNTYLFNATYTTTGKGAGTVQVTNNNPPNTTAYAANITFVNLTPVNIDGMGMTKVVDTTPATQIEIVNDNTFPPTPNPAVPAIVVREQGGGMTFEPAAVFNTLELVVQTGGGNDNINVQVPTNNHGVVSLTIDAQGGNDTVTVVAGGGVTLSGNFTVTAETIESKAPVAVGKNVVYYGSKSITTTAAITAGGSISLLGQVPPGGPSVAVTGTVTTGAPVISGMDTTGTLPGDIVIIGTDILLNGTTTSGADVNSPSGLIGITGTKSVTVNAAVSANPAALPVLPATRSVTITGANADDPSQLVDVILNAPVTGDGSVTVFGTKSITSNAAGTVTATNGSVSLLGQAPPGLTATPVTGTVTTKANVTAGADVTVTGTAVEFNAPVQAAGSVTVFGTNSITTTVAGTVTATNGSVSLLGQAPPGFAATLITGTVTTNANVNAKTDVTVTGTGVRFNAPVTATGSVTVFGTNSIFTTTAGTVTATTGSASLFGQIPLGGPAVPVTGLVITNAKVFGGVNVNITGTVVSLNAPVEATGSATVFGTQSITTTAPGVVTPAGGTVTASLGTVSLIGQAPGVSPTTGSVTTGAAVSGGTDATIAGTTVVLNGTTTAITGTAVVVGNASVSVNQNLTAGQNVAVTGLAAPVTINAASVTAGNGTVALNNGGLLTFGPNPVTVSGAAGVLQTGGDVSLTGPTTILRSANGFVTVSGAVNSPAAGALVVSAGTTAALAGPVGLPNALGQLDVSGQTIVLTGGYYFTSGSQTYTGPIGVASPTGATTFSTSAPDTGTVTFTNTFGTSESQSVEFNLAGPANLLFQGGVNVAGTLSVVKANDVTFNGPLTAGSVVIAQANDVMFKGLVTTTGSIGITKSNAVTSLTGMFVGGSVSVGSAKSVAVNGSTNAAGNFDLGDGTTMTTVTDFTVNGGLGAGARVLQSGGGGTTTLGTGAFVTAPEIDLTNNRIVIGESATIRATNSVRLNPQGGGVTELPGGQIVTNQLILAGSATGGTRFDINQPGNQVNGTFQATVNGTVALRVNSGLTIEPNGGVTTNGGDVGLTVGGDLKINGTASVNTGGGDFYAEVGGNTRLDGTGGIATNGGNVMIYTNGGFDAVDRNANKYQSAMIDAGAGTVLVVSGLMPGIPDPNVAPPFTFQYDAEVKGSTVQFGNKAGSGSNNNINRDRFVIRPSRFQDIQVFGNDPNKFPGDSIQPILTGYTGVNLTLDPQIPGTDSFSGFYTVGGSNFRLRFAEIESFGNLGFQGMVVQTGARSYAIRLQLIQTSPINNSVQGQGINSNPFVVAPNFVSINVPYGVPTIAFGDVNGDGQQDLVIANGPNDFPTVTVVDGKALFSTGMANATTQTPLLLQNLSPGKFNPSNGTGGLIAQFFPFEPTYRGGVEVTVADFDGSVNDKGNTNAEIAVGAMNGGGPRVQVWKYAGPSGGIQVDPSKAMGAGPVANFFAFEPTFRGGVHVGAGDLDGDGVADLLIGAGNGGAPRVQVFSGPSVMRNAPQEIASFFAYEPTYRGGVLVAGGQFDGTTTGGKNPSEILTAPGTGQSSRLRVFGFNPDNLRVAPQVLADFLAFPQNSINTAATNTLLASSQVGAGVGSLAFGNQPLGTQSQDILVSTARGPQLSVLRYTKNTPQNESGAVLTSVPTPSGTLFAYDLFTALTPTSPTNLSIIDPLTGQVLTENMLYDGGSVAGFYTDSTTPT